MVRTGGAERARAPRPGFDSEPAVRPVSESAPAPRKLSMSAAISGCPTSRCPAASRWYPASVTVSVTSVGGADAGDHLDAVALGAALHQRVETVLGIQQVRGPGAATGESSDPPRLRVGGMLRVPGLVRAMERAQAEVQGADRPRLAGRRPAPAAQPGQKRKTSRGSRWARSL